MIEKYEKLQDSTKLDEKGEVMKDEKGEILKEFKEVAKAEATHVHYCGHDKDPPEPCRRVKIK
jgi:hypothetical protein